MQAISHSTSITPISPTADIMADPLHNLSTPSRTEQRRAEVDRAVAEIVEAAEAVGWVVEGDRTFSNGASRYLDMKLTNGVAITLRVADHCPSRALGVAGDRPMLISIIGIPGGLSHAKAWLNRMAAQVNRVRRGETHKARLRVSAA
ncbi:hypothetical protein OT109_01415 [Phycisphaeraceae bacterium D3-23]